MAQKVAKLGIKRDSNFMYYIKKGDVWRVPRKRPGKPKGKPERVAKVGAEMDAERNRKIRRTSKHIVLRAFI